MTTDTPPTTASPAPSYRTAAGVSIAAFVLYLLGLAPTIGLWDAGEYIAAAAGMGIPHPPGNPGFVLLGRVVSLLPIARTVAERLNVLVALASALSCGLWFLVAEHISRHWLGVTKARVAAGAAALLGATAFTVWNQSVVNEKVYTISLFLLALDFWSAIRWQAEPDGPRADRRLALICYRLGLGYTIHIAGLLAGPAVLAAVLTTRPRTLRRGRVMLACGALFVLGLTPFVSIPIRAAFRLEINEGHPTACEGGRPELGCTLSAKTFERFMYAHNRTQYAKPSLLDRQESMQNQVKMWWLYFKWQWFRDPARTSPEGQSALTVLMLVLAGLGGYAHRRYDRRTFIPFAVLIATLTIGLIYYLNFELGYTQAAEMGVAGQRPTEARDRDYFYLWSYSALAVWIGFGLAFAWRKIAEFLADGERGPAPALALRPRRRHWILASAVFVVALVPLALNANSAPRRGETFPEDYAVDLLNSVEPNGVLFTGGDNDTFPVWFAQQVLGIRRDVTVVIIAYLPTDWYVREIINKVPEPYDPLRGPRIYRDLAGTPPKGPILALTTGAADSIPDMTETFAPQRLQMPGWVLELPAGSVPRQLIMMLRIIHDAGAERPIYFSHGAGSPEIELLFRPHFVRQGLAQKLVPDPSKRPGVVMTKELGPVDVPRTQALWANFRGTKAMMGQGPWLDEASANVPYAYVTLGLAMSDAYLQLGDRTAAGAVSKDVLAMARSMDFGRYMRDTRARITAPTGLGYAPVAR